MTHFQGLKFAGILNFYELSIIPNKKKKIVRKCTKLKPYKNVKLQYF